MLRKSCGSNQGAMLAKLFKMKVASFRVLTPWFPTHQGSSGVIVVEVHGLILLFFLIPASLHTFTN